MTRDDIIRMAREAGAVFDNDDCLDDCAIEIWARFAALIASAEREAIAKMFDGEVWAYDYREIAAAIRARGEQIKEFAKKSVEQIAKELTSVQPMPDTLFSDLNKAGKGTKELKAEGYVPVSNLGLMWIKKDEE